jgi:hypothetical protein
MVVAGHSVDLYTYDGPLTVPKGVTVRDAGEVLPRERVFFHAKTGSPALFADLFRSAGLQRRLGTWVDTDIVLLRSISDLGDYIFGWESPGKLNIAVLRLPPDCPYMGYIEQLATARVPLPIHWSITRKLRQLARACVGRQLSLQQLEWGAAGPLALTEFVRRNGLAEHAQPKDVFYPIHWSERALLLAPSETVDLRLTHQTRAVHLWHKGLTEDQKERPPPGSFLARMCERFAVA